MFTFKVLILFVICFISFNIRLTVSLIPEFYENYRIKEGQQIRSFETPSIQNCIHKCQFDEKCNIANAKVATKSKVQCVLARIECFEKLHEKMQQAHGWQLYKLPEKHCKARPVQENHQNVSTQSAKPFGSTITSNITSSKEKDCNKKGNFKIMHQGSQKYLHYISTQNIIVLREDTTDKFSLNNQGYLNHTPNGFCFRNDYRNGLYKIALNPDCSSNDANFFFKEDKIYYQNEEFFLVVVDGYLKVGTICEDESQCKFKQM